MSSPTPNGPLDSTDPAAAPEADARPALGPAPAHPATAAPWLNRAVLPAARRRITSAAVLTAVLVTAAVGGYLLYGGGDTDVSAATWQTGRAGQHVTAAPV